MTVAVRWPSAFALSLALHATGIALLVAFVRLQPQVKWIPNVEVSLVQPLVVGAESASTALANPSRPVRASAPRQVAVTASVPVNESQADEENGSDVVETGVAFPQAGHAGGGEAMDLETRFLSEFRSSVSRRKFYPPQAKRQRAEGRVMVDVVLRKDGGFESLKIAESSASGTLDQAALEILRRVEGRHPIPDELERSRWALRVPVEFQLDNEE